MSQSKEKKKYSVPSKEDLVSFVFPAGSSRVYIHEGNTKLITHSNLNYLDKIINVELFSESNKNTPFVVVSFGSEVLPQVYDQHVWHLLDTVEVPSAKGSFLYPTQIRAGNFYNDMHERIGIVYQTESLSPSGVCNDLVKKEEDELREFLKCMGAKEVLRTGRKRKWSKRLSDCPDLVLRGGRNSTDVRDDDDDNSNNNNEDDDDDNPLPIPLESTTISLFQSNQRSLPGRNGIIFSGGIFSRLENCKSDCVCSADDCSRRGNSSCADFVGAPFLHMAYSHQYKLPTTGGKEGLSSIRNFELTLQDLFKLEKGETFNCSYPIVKTLLKFEQLTSGEGVKHEGWFDMSEWNNVIRSFFQTSLDSGLTNPWTYLGLANTLFYTHVEDYLAVNSVNLLLYGASKVWIFIHPESQTKFEDFLMDYLKSKASIAYDGSPIPKGSFPPCFPGHKSFFVHPLLLERNGIEFTIVEQRVGDMIVTKKGAYHYGFNLGVNIAVSQNMIFEDFLFSLTKSFINPFSSRPFCPANICTYKHEDSGKESKRDIMMFLLKAYEHALSKTGVKCSRPDIINWILMKSGENKKSAAGLGHRVEAKLHSAAKAIEKMIRDMEEEVLCMLYPLQSTTTVFVSAQVTKKAFIMPVSKLVFPTNPLSAKQLKTFFSHPKFSNIAFYSLDDKGVKKATTRFLSLSEICNEWFAKIPPVSTCMKVEGNHESKHSSISLECCKNLIENSKLCLTLQKGESELIIIKDSSKIACLIEKLKKYFICLDCLTNANLKRTLELKINDYTGKWAETQVTHRSVVNDFNIEDMGDIGVFKSTTALKNHVKRNTLRITCKECKKSFSDWPAASNHYREEHEVWVLECPICGRHLSSPDKFKRHLKSTRTSCLWFHYSTSSSTSFNVTQYFCRKCKLHVSNIDELIVHYDSQKCVLANSQD